MKKVANKNKLHMKKRDKMYIKIYQAQKKG